MPRSRIWAAGWETGGIDEVIVGGGFVVHEGKFTKNRPGRIVQ